MRHTYNINIIILSSVLAINSIGLMATSSLGYTAELAKPGTTNLRHDEISMPLLAPRFVTDEQHARFNPITNSDNLTGAQQASSDCIVNFNNKTVLQFLPDNAINSDVGWPWWNQECTIDNRFLAIHPLHYSHYHLGYEDPRINNCPDLGEYGKHEETPPENYTEEEFTEWLFTPCEPIDPVTETRSDITPHSAGFTIQIFLYDLNVLRRPFTMNQIRVVRGPARLCYKKAGEWEAAYPGGSPGWFCLENLGTGPWDLSAIVTNVVEVHVTSATEDNITLDDIHVQSNQ